MFDRFASRLRYVSGDFTASDTFARVADAAKGAQSPVFYLEIPPFLFGTVVAGLADAGFVGTDTLTYRAANARVASEPVTVTLSVTATVTAVAVVPRFTG